MPTAILEPTRFTAPADGQLSDAQRDAYARDGFLVLEGFATPQSCEALIRRAGELVDAFEPSDVASIFSTVRQTEATDRYFLDSGDDIRFFFEENAFNPDGSLRQGKALSINKIGHALHDLDPVFSAFSRQPKMAALARDVGLEQPLLMQSMYIFKQPRIGGEVVCHQDSTFLYTEPMTVTGFWVALQDATLENGCLWALPGGHLSPLKKRFVRTPEGGVRMETLDPTPWPEFGETEPYVPLEVKQGTLVVLHGLLPHLSGPNLSDRSRHAYTLHVVDGVAHYPEENWLHRHPDRPARGF